MKQYSLTPNFSDEIFSERFNQIDDFFSRLTGKNPVSNYPNYDLKKIDDYEYILTISVPGYSESEIEILTKNKQLFIRGKRNNDNKNEENKKIIFINKNIIQKNFTLRFNIGDDLKVSGAKLKNGLLDILLKQEISEEDKIQKISISS